MKKYRIGMYGAGSIAKTVVQAIGAIDRIEKYSVASRCYKNAVSFKEAYGFQVAYSYSDLIGDPLVDFVYISTPTGYHYEAIKKCLQGNKHVICEKTLVTSLDEAQEVIALAREKSLILMDATWTLYTPMFNYLDGILAGNTTLGKAKRIVASFGGRALGNPRLRDANGGGALLDVGIYCIAVANRFFKDPVSLSGKNRFLTGVDIDNKIRIKYKQGSAKIHSSICKRTACALVIAFEKGIILSRCFWTGKKLYIWKYPLSIRKMVFPHIQNGYEYEFLEMVELLDKRMIESPTVPHAETLKNMYIIDAAKQSIRYNNLGLSTDILAFSFISK